MTQEKSKRPHAALHRPLRQQINPPYPETQTPKNPTAAHAHGPHTGNLGTLTIPIVRDYTLPGPVQAQATLQHHKGPAACGMQARGMCAQRVVITHKFYAHAAF
jgi:hypothetical protein